MFIAIEHEIHDSDAFQEGAQRVYPLPEDLQVHQFLPASDFSRAVCLFEAPSVDQLRDHIDGTLGESSTQRYFRVAEDNAIGLPRG